MSVGNALTKTTVDNQLTQLAVQLRNLMSQVRWLNEQVNGQGDGAAVLAALGYATTANADNPGGVSDQGWALEAVDLMSLVSQLYYGFMEGTVTVSAAQPATAVAGDFWVNTGGTTQPPGQLNRYNGTAWAVFSVENALAPLWAGG